jgi:hypothetical protein
VCANVEIARERAHQLHANARVLLLTLSATFATTAAKKAMVTKAKKAVIICGSFVCALLDAL